MDVQVKTKLTKYIPAALFLVSGIYYYALSSKIFTWIYTSGDAGDWLVQTNWWMVPQCWGKPFYIALIHFTSLFPSDDVLKITLLSVIAGAAMVSLTYLIARRMTGSVKLGLIASLVVMGSNIILSQSTVLEQYTVVGALCLAFFYFYQQEKLLLAAVFLGLMAASHELGIVFAVLFVFVEWGRIKKLLKYSPVFILFGLVPYLLIAGMMIADTPKLLAGYLSLEGLNAYGGNTTVTAAMALTETPARFKEVAMVLVTALGFAIVPIWVGFKRPWDSKTRFILAAFGFSLWFYFTNLFPSTWKFLVPTLPLVVCMMAVGLSKLPHWHRYIVTAGAIVLIIVNVFQFNTNTMAEEKPLATEYLAAVMELPDGAAIITPRGGAYGFTLFYAMSEGKDIIPLALRKPDDEWLSRENNQGYIDYLLWLEREYGIEGQNTYYIVKDAMAKGHPIYFATPMTTVWDCAFVYEENDMGYLFKVTDVLADPPWPNTSFDSIWGDYWKLKDKAVGDD